MLANKTMEKNEAHYQLLIHAIEIDEEKIEAKNHECMISMVIMNTTIKI
jgi:hypothetical protein